ncbi:MAG TPA: hypothetical protein VME17_10000 [Bryobacteraceae bacterium]|nr:hypothetical protein [Bryobacteraceae bacterium]
MDHGAVAFARVCDDSGKSVVDRVRDLPGFQEATKTEAPQLRENACGNNIQRPVKMRILPVLADILAEVHVLLERTAAGPFAIHKHPPGLAIEPHLAIEPIRRILAKSFVVENHQAAKIAREFRPQEFGLHVCRLAAGKIAFATEAAEPKSTTKRVLLDPAESNQEQLTLLESVAVNRAADLLQRTERSMRPFDLRDFVDLE